MIEKIKYKAKKSLGQNFLKNKGIIDFIIKEANININDNILEIGPGMGAMTELLLNNNPRKVIAVEKDRELFEILGEKFQSYIDNKSLLLINEDILKFDVDNYLKINLVDDYKLIANIPYYITGAILEMFVNISNRPYFMLLMMQREVGDRIIAKDGKQSILSLAIRLYGKAQVLKVVHKGSFDPIPKVDSCIIRIDIIKNIEDKYLKIEGNGKYLWDFKKYEKTYLEIIKSGLAHKRKKLISNLKVYNNDFNWEMLFNKLEIGENVRGEDLSFEKWILLVEGYLYEG